MTDAERLIRSRLDIRDPRPRAERDQEANRGILTGLAIIAVGAAIIFFWLGVT